tara:strand:- start:2685 stop:2996 length:312 start_codon:yes stop_codon:yes gene_type:complete
MEFKKYAQDGAEMNPMEALRLAQESRAFAAQGVEMPSDMTAGMAKYGMSDTQFMKSGGPVEGKKVKLLDRMRAKSQARKQKRYDKKNPSFQPPSSDSGTQNRE